MQFSFGFEIDDSSQSNPSSNNEEAAPSPQIECSSNKPSSITKIAPSPPTATTTKELSILCTDNLNDINYDELDYENIHILPLDASATTTTTSHHDVPALILKRINLPQSTTNNHNNDGPQTLDESSDLIPGLYEGGLKTWECSLDLCSYLHAQKRMHHQTNDGDLSHVLDNNDNDGSSTLELGCGHGLPGILIAQWTTNHRNKNSSTVLFSDYNDYVLQNATLPNLILNGLYNKEEKSLSQRIGLVAGDWMHLSNRLQPTTTPNTTSEEIISAAPADGRFDLILAAETTYTASSAYDTALLLSRHLKKGVGIGLLAMKRYYFGVGGGSDAFRNVCSDMVVVSEGEGGGEKIGWKLVVETLHVYDNGFGNIRELLHVKLLPSS